MTGHHVTVRSVRRTAHIWHWRGTCRDCDWTYNGAWWWKALHWATRHADGR